MTPTREEPIKQSYNPGEMTSFLQKVSRGGLFVCKGEAVEVGGTGWGNVSVLGVLYSKNWRGASIDLQLENASQNQTFMSQLYQPFCFSVALD